jgi:hypothetical protein
MMNVPAPSTTPTYAILPGAPDDPTVTRVVEINPMSTKVVELSQLTTYDEVAKASQHMTHGAIVGMVKWCQTQGAGTSPPWRFKRVLGIPMPVFALIIVLLLIYGSWLGWPIDVLIIGLMITTVVFFGATYLLSEYEHNARGKCFICGTGVDTEGRFSKPIEMFNRNGAKRQITKSGYCEECAWNVHRKNLWSTVEAAVWNLIQQHPERERNWRRIVGYKLFWWLGYVEVCTDPRPVGRGAPYRKRDRNTPKDDTDTNHTDNIVRLAGQIIEQAQASKKR